MQLQRQFLQLGVSLPQRARTSGKHWQIGAAAVLCLIWTTNARADLSGTYNASSSVTGNTQIAGPSGSFTVGSGGPGFCVGPPVNCGGGQGVSGSATVNPTNVMFSFFGSTAGAGPGSFTINLTGFSGPITGFTLASGSLGGATATTSFTSTSLSATFTTGTDFNALGGTSLTFNVVSAAAVPEVSSVYLLLTAALPVAVWARRRARASHS